MSDEIHPSSVGIEAVSTAGDSLEGSGALPTSSMLVSMVLLEGELPNDDNAGAGSRRGWAQFDREQGIAQCSMKLAKMRQE